MRVERLLEKKDSAASFSLTRSVGADVMPQSVCPTTTRKPYIGVTKVSPSTKLQ